MPRYTKERPKTICLRCRFHKTEFHSQVCFSHEIGISYDVVTGHKWVDYPLCVNVNDGNCEWFQEKISWFRRLRWKSK